MHLDLTELPRKELIHTDTTYVLSFFFLSFNVSECRLDTMHNAASSRTLLFRGFTILLTVALSQIV
jgi:hypothetical protein